MKKILRLEQLAYAYEKGSYALKNIDLTVHAGERIAVLGNNGAGKSTLFLCACGVLPPQKGAVYLDEQRVTQKNMTALRRAAGIVFQDADNQIIGATVEAEVGFGPSNLMLSADEITAATDAALSQMQLQSLRSRPPHFLSGGEKKRVSIADILAMQPQVIFMDEPTASLDTLHVQKLEETLAALSAQGIALVVATHDMNFAWRFATRGIVMEGGEILADAPLADIFADDALLDKANLAKPILYEAAQALQLSKMPRSIAELKQMIKEP